MIINKLKKKVFISAIFLSFLASCGGGNSSSQDEVIVNDIITPTTEQGGGASAPTCSAALGVLHDNDKNRIALMCELSKIAFILSSAPILGIHFPVILT